MPLTMDKNLLGMVWGLPAYFALPSVAACRRALAQIRPQLMQLQAGGFPERRRKARF